MRSVSKVTLAMAMLALSSNNVWAQSGDTNGWHPVVQLGVTVGGDELVELEVENSFGRDSDEEIRAGELFLAAGGIAYQINQFEVQATIGFYGDGIFADNGDASFTRWPLELMAFWRFEYIRVGAGVTQHFNPQFELDIDNGAKSDVDFDDATGFLFQVEYLINDNISVGLRHTVIDYEIERRAMQINGDNTGVVATYRF